MSDSTIPKLRAQLASAGKDARWADVLSLSEKLWELGDRRSSTCLIAVKAASALSEFSLSEGWIDRGLSECEPDWRLLRLKGDSYRNRQSWREACTFYAKAAALAPNEPVPAALLGSAHLRLREFSDAAVSLRRAVMLAGAKPHPTWLVQLGAAESKLGHLMEAKHAFAQANSIRPEAKLEWFIADLDRRVAMGNQSVAATAEFYDEVFSQAAEYRLGWRESTYSSVWLALIELLRNQRVQSILDLGCGPGQFADCVAEMLPGVNYFGVDFSAVAVERARDRHPDFRFVQLELPVASYEQFSPFDAVVCTEVLEHIEADVPVIRPIPSGTFVVFTVPNFDSFGHVRVFKSAAEVSDRYSELFRELHIIPFDHGSSNIFWITSGFRGDS